MIMDKQYLITLALKKLGVGLIYLMPSSPMSPKHILSRTKIIWACPNNFEQKDSGPPFLDFPKIIFGPIEGWGH